jgi:catechol 2,3-dioxygenase-like lactoylglutathione lyase family enzyme
MIDGIDHVQVAAPRGCEPAARAFYGELLGLPELPKPPPLAGRGGAWFGPVHVGVEEPFAPARKAHPALRVAGADALRVLADRLAGAGAPVRWDEAIAGRERFYTDDPWGNRLELIAAEPDGR